MLIADARVIKGLNDKFEKVGKFVTLCFRLLYHFDAYSSEVCIKKLNEYKELEDLLRIVVLDTDNFYIRDRFTDGIGDMLCHNGFEIKEITMLQEKVLKILIFSLSKDHEKMHIRTYKYYDFMVKLLQAIPNEAIREMTIDFEEVLKMNVEIIINKESIEKSSTDYDTILCGSVKIVK